MILPFVADASVAISWVHPAQATRETQAMLRSLADGAVLEVPALWPLEVSNALLVLTRRRRLQERERRAALTWLMRLPVTIDNEAAELAFSRLSDLAFERKLSVYDAAYLELAKRKMLPLACKDGPLREAAKRERVPLWRPGK